MTADAGPTSLPTLLAYLIDEMREAGELLRVPDVQRAASRPLWRKALSSIFKTTADLTATMAMRYLPANIDRAHDHWREAISTWGQIIALHAGDGTVAALRFELDILGFADVAGQLHSEALPPRQAEAATHVATVMTVIRDCEDAVVKARTRLRLQRMRQAET